MAAPIDDDLEFRGASPNVVQADDSEAVGGSMAGAALDENVANLLFDATAANPIGGADIIHHNVFYRFNAEGSGGKCLAGALYLYNGMALNTSAGVASASATTPDAGKIVLLLGFSGGLLVASLITLINGTATGAESFDLSNLFRGELLDSSGTNSTTAAADIMISVAGQDVALIRAGQSQVTAEYELAIATGVDVDCASASRLDAPSDIGSFSRPVRFGAVNSALSCPDILDGERLCIAVRKTLKAGLPAPRLGYIKFFHDLEFTAAA